MDMPDGYGQTAMIVMMTTVMVGITKHNLISF